MSVYYVEPDDLMRELALQDLTRACQPAIAQLVARFDLAKKTLMSIGSGGSHEEAAFLREGLRRAFLFDIDEWGTVEPVLQRIDHPSRKADALFSYFIDDFVQVQPNGKDVDPIDVLYFGGFTPDEVRRHDISKDYKENPPRPPEQPKQSKWFGWLSPAPTHVVSNSPDPDWPSDTSPLHDIVLEAIDRFLVAGGYFIVQSYYAGIDVQRNPNYVALWKSVLAEHNVDLLEVYYFTASPAVTLWVGRKRGGHAGDKPLSRKDLQTRPPITRFHARAQLADCSIAQLDLSD